VLRDHVLETMASLQLHGMRAAFDEVVAAGLKHRDTPEKILLDLLSAESAERRLRSIRYRLGQARFPIDKDLDSFDFAASPVNEPLVRSLYQGSFLAPRSNVILVGGTGTGKTHLAVAIARQAIKTGAKGRFFNLVDLVNQLEQEKLDGRGGRLATHLARLDLVVFDELGYLPFSKAGGQLLFHQLDLRGMAPGLRRYQDDHGPTRPGHTPLLDPGDGQRELEDSDPYDQLTTHPWGGSLLDADGGSKLEAD
jgi:DNA replication protein DnaC